MTAHPVSDEEEVSTVAAVVRRRLRQAGLADPEGAGQLGDEEVVLVGRTDPAGVGEPEAAEGDREGRTRQHIGFRMRAELFGGGHEVSLSVT